jgi:hypothetical protein
MRQSELYAWINAYGPVTPCTPPHHRASVCARGERGQSDQPSAIDLTRSTIDIMILGTKITFTTNYDATMT